jgi:chromosome segregation ATPase
MGREKQEEGDVRALERKVQGLEQKIHDLESRIQNIDEANHRVYQKWNTTEERFHQQQGETRALIVRCQNLERRIDLLAFERCERIEDDIIVIEES